MAEERDHLTSARYQGRQPTYGIDAPSVVLGLTVAGVGCWLLSAFGAGGGIAGLAVAGAISGAFFFAGALYMVYSSVRGKKQLWRRELDALDLRGDEQTLDVGCGRGLVLIETAKRLPKGRSVGIDLWRNRDQSGNAKVVTEANAGLEEVADRVDVRDGDMTALPFEDGSFDLVTASLALHNIPDRDARRTAIDEIARVVRPGGRVVILDMFKTTEYVEDLHAAGLDDAARSGRHLATYPPSYTVTATRGGAP